MSEFTLKQKLDMWQRTAIGEAPTNVTIIPEYVVELHNDVKELYDRIAELESAQRWRVIADGEFPEDRATVLVAFTEYPEQIDILTATYYKHYEGFGGVDNWWDIEGWYSGDVTHWMPLPKPPEVQQ